MDLHLYDTAIGEVRPLETRKAGEVSIYVCGPTVYDLPHIGHGRMALTYDVLRRYVESRGIEVVHVSNITDIEDKIIKRAKDSGQPAEVITATYERAWWDALDKMGVARPTHDPHATSYVEEMVELIGKLVAGGYAYETSDTVYFAPGNVDGYGLLARQSVESLQAGARVEADEEKRSPIDFALWKKIPADTGEPVWPSPWGTGRPGWHTECVVMSLDLLGDGFDIHAGGMDLAFPHHENERAQAIASGNVFARHWMHNGFVEMGGEKMSKSLGNFTTLTELLDKVDARAYRLLILRAHYRSPIEVTSETLADAEAALARLDDFARRFAAVVEGAQPDQRLLDGFNTHMDRDLDTPKALAELFAAVRDANAQQSASVAAAVFAMAKAVGLQLHGAVDVADDTTLDLVAARDAARATKDWAKSDALREELRSLGWVVEDTPEGTKIHK